MKAQNSSTCVISLKYETFPLEYGYFVCGPTLAVVIMVGLLGNGLCLVTLCKARPVPVVNYYTIPLCICDCAVLLGSFFMTNLPHLMYGRMQTYGPYVRVYPFMNFFANFAYTSCVWLVIFLSVERYFALCHPLRHKIYDARRRSVLISISCLLSAFIYNIPHYFEVEVFECLERRSRSMVALMAPAHFRTTTAYWIAFKVVLGPMLFSFGPFLFLCFLSVRIWREVKKAHLPPTTLPLIMGGEERQSLIAILQRSPSRRPQSVSTERMSNGRGSGSDCRNLSNERQRRLLTYTLLYVVLKFLVCHSLPAIIDLCETLMAREQFQCRLIENLVDTSTLLVAVNSSCSVFVYAWCSGEFRNRIRALLTKGSARQTSADV